MDQPAADILMWSSLTSNSQRQLSLGNLLFFVSGVPISWGIGSVDDRIGQGRERKSKDAAMSKHKAGNTILLPFRAMSW